MYDRLLCISHDVLFFDGFFTCGVWFDNFHTICCPRIAILITNDLDKYWHPVSFRIARKCSATQHTLLLKVGSVVSRHIYVDFFTNMLMSIVCFVLMNPLQAFKHS